VIHSRLILQTLGFIHVTNLVTYLLKDRGAFSIEGPDVCSHGEILKSEASRSSLVVDYKKRFSQTTFKQTIISF
jgi:hypothetical protein